MSKSINITGLRFGMLTVIKRAQSKNGSAYWQCKCDCGTLKDISGYSLRSKHTKSCGCKNRLDLTEAITTHGGRNTDLYKIWSYMKTRCCNTNYEHYARYGGRGIFVCEEWLNDFEMFRKWSHENGYTKGLEIDRKDNEKGYSPDNCTWSTRTEQVRNRSNTVFITQNEVTKPLIEWCEMFGVKYKLAHSRYKKGMSFEKIFRQPVGVTYLDSLRG